MFLVFLILFDPANGWRRVAESCRSLARLVFIHLLPLLLIGCVAEGYGIMRWGKRVGDFGATRTYELPQVIGYQACHFVAGLMVVLLSAWVLKVVSNTFQHRQKFIQALAVSVFALGPVFLLRICDAFPMINPWISWGIGAVLVVAFLYQGAPRVMHLDPAHALGVYMSSAVLLVMISGLGRFVVVMFLQSKVLEGPL